MLVRVSFVARWPLWLALMIYSALTVVTLLSWDARGVYGLSGDEPHYLVMADALFADGTTELTAAYQREFQQQTIYPLGLDNEAETPRGEVVPPAAHVVSTAHGLFSWHGWGAAAIGGVGWALGGDLGARLIMALSGFCVLACTWLLTGVAGSWRSSLKFRAGALVALALAYPILLASTQIFPDVWAGAFMLLILTWAALSRWVGDSRVAGWNAAPVIVGLALGALPWFGIKFAPAAAVLAVLALVVSRHRNPRSITWLMTSAALLLWIALAVYNVQIFGAILGPPTEGTLVFGLDFLMLLPGLLFDQNQGFLFFNPVLWLAVPGTVLLWRRDRFLSAIWGATFVTVWVPAAAHPGLYGLGGFNGRYSWPLALLAIVPAVLGLQWLALRFRGAAITVMGVVILFQLQVFLVAVFVGGSSPGSALGLDLYTRPAGTWLESYAAWWFPLQRFFPAWYDTEWAFGYLVNYFWIGIAVLLLVVAARRMWSWTRRRVAMPVTVALGLVFLLGVTGVSNPGPRTSIVTADASEVAGVDTSGYVEVGPVRAMRLGTYTWWVDYQSNGDGPVGKWELVRVLDDAVVAAGELSGTQGQPVRAEANIPFRSLQPREFLFRVGWYGSQDMNVSQTGVSFAGVG